MTAHGLHLNNKVTNTLAEARAVQAVTATAGQAVLGTMQSAIRVPPFVNHAVHQGQSSIATNSSNASPQITPTGMAQLVRGNTSDHIQASTTARIKQKKKRRNNKLQLVPRDFYTTCLMDVDSRRLIDEILRSCDRTLRNIIVTDLNDGTDLKAVLAKYPERVACALDKLELDIRTSATKLQEYRPRPVGITTRATANTPEISQKPDDPPSQSEFMITEIWTRKEECE